MQLVVESGFEGIKFVLYVGDNGKNFGVYGGCQSVGQIGGQILQNVGENLIHDDKVKMWVGFVKLYNAFISYGERFKCVCSFHLGEWN